MSITSVAPKDIPAGSTTVTLTVTGTGFTASTQIVLNGVTETTSYISSTELRATISTAQLATGAILNLSLKDGAKVIAADTSNNVQVSNPVPTVTTLSPGNILVGSAATDVTVSGTNFVSGVALSVNGSPRTTTYVSATQLTANLTANDFANATPLLLNVVNPQPGGGASGTIAFSVNNPAPTITSVSPNTGSAGSAATTVTITGSGFVAGTNLLVNGAARPSTFVNNTSMKVVLSAADLASSGTLAIAAINAAPGGGISSTSAFAVNNPAPGAITLTPSSGLSGSGASQVSVAGSNFVPSTVIYVNDTPRATTYISSSQAIVSLTAADLATAGSLSIVAKTPSPGGGNSAVASFAINNPVPGALTVSPSTIATGTATQTQVTVTGANFVSSSVVQVNGNARPTTYVSSTQLLTTLTAADQATSGSLSITVVTPAPGGGTSSAASIAINNPTLGAITVSPSSVPAGRTTNTTITVGGANFQPGTTIQVNGSPRATTYFSASQVSFILLPADVTTTGTLNITAVNPAPNSSISDTARLSVVTPTVSPVISSISPSSAIVGSSSVQLYAYLSAGFVSSCTLQWNGVSIPTGYTYGQIYNPSGSYPYTYGYSLYSSISASNLATKGNVSITAYCPTASNPTSNAVTFSITDPPVPTLTSLSATAGPVAKDTSLTLYGTGFTAATVASFNGYPLTTSYVSSTSLTVTVPAARLQFPGIGRFTVTTPAPGGGTSAALGYTTYVPIVSNSMVYNPVDGLLYLSIPSGVGAPYGNSVVSMDPATGALGAPIFVGNEPNKMAVTADGKYLWVGLDGSFGVRKVDLTTKQAGLQFALNISGSSSNAGTVMSMIPMPGQTDSVILLQGSYYSSQLAIYDAGVLRGALGTNSYYSQYALQVDSSRNEIYVGGSGLYTYTYSSSGITAKASNTNSNIQIASSSLDDMQLSSGKLYGNFGKVYDAEAGTTLSSMYVSGTTVAQGPTFLDTTLNKVFILDSSSGYCCSSYNQIQVFNPADSTATGAVIPISVPSYITNSSGSSIYLSPHKLVRWGRNGLAFHTTGGIFSLRSNNVQDISSEVADLSVAVSASGDTTTGANSTYTVTVTNSGPQTATDVALALQIPSTGKLQNATSSSGSCAASTGGCSLGSIASGASVTVTVTVLQTTAGTATLSAFVSSSTTDNTSTNDSANASLNVTGADYYLAPALTSVSPNAIKSGSSDTAITITGLNFNANSVVMLGATALNTTFTSSTQLSAMVPASLLTSMGWSVITVSTPAPGGGVSNAVPLTIYTALSLGVNHVVYDPYSRKLMTSVSTGSSTIAGSSLVALTPETATFGTPVALSVVPNKLALSNSGQTLYLGNNSNQTIDRYNMATGAVTTLSIPGSTTCTYCGAVPQEIAVSPGSENTVALSMSNYYPYVLGIYDYSTVSNTLTRRTNYSSYYYNATCLRYLDSASLFASLDYNSSVTYFGIDSNGLTSTSGTASALSRFGCFKLAGNKGYSYNGGVATFSSGGAVTQTGAFTMPSSYSANPTAMEPDTSLRTIFFAGNTSNQSYGNTDGIVSYDTGTYLRTGAISLNIPTIEGTTSFNIQDVVRWGQDGLALVTSTGHLYLLRGPFVVPQLLGTNTSATLTSSSLSTITHGTGNTLLTLTGSNFLPGVAVTWNGSYRTTTIVDSTHVTVAIPASDLTTTGSASVVATNPGATASGTLTITIN
ncbi:beta strand repeat-containing protein [Terriglobus albidus]|uniref:beta strand repeat-containing protein n=1 Tax=Terriglobus albidus TaxID=1592106 RepID=UPI0021DF89E5|nr:IPT/TIG domain-containing protein [Terriglobus albidus]